MMSAHVIRNWIEWEIGSTHQSRVLVIETDAEMRPGETGYDVAILEEVRTAAALMLNASASPIDRIRIVPVRY